MAKPFMANRLYLNLQSESDEQVFTTSHRAYLQQNYFAKLDDLTETEKSQIAKTHFHFWISSFSPLQLACLRNSASIAIFTCSFLTQAKNIGATVWKKKVWQKLALSHKISQDDLDNLLAEQRNKLLNLWANKGGIS
ncbi:Uncharacterised protein [Mannheimia haemolytica]|uniref:Uncharacterized protein n=1 Tax=Mannheimia haemolytica TaxID=75985 RepID=A0A378MVD2_MANHA|nr:Uncharacterised protein [Mannheimia haemolytica]